MTKNTKPEFAPTVTHWGAYGAEISDRRVVALHPFEHDPDPSPIGASISGALTDRMHIPQPMIRAGWLQHGPRLHDNARGRDAYVAVSWDEALDFVAGEFNRIRKTHGNESIHAGSYGWGKLVSDTNSPDTGGNACKTQP